MTKPEIGSTWTHKNGNEYVVEGFANEESTKEDYPVMIIYRNKETGMRWARKLSDWGRSMILKEEDTNNKKPWGELDNDLEENTIPASEGQSMEINEALGLKTSSMTWEDNREDNRED